LLTNGSGWFGAVDLLPGDYVLETTSLPPGMKGTWQVTIIAGTVAAADLTLNCPQGSKRLYLPQITKGFKP
jgi:hypothetical protein